MKRCHLALSDLICYLSSLNWSRIWFKLFMRVEREKLVGGLLKVDCSLREEDD